MQGSTDFTVLRKNKYPPFTVEALMCLDKQRGHLFHVRGLVKLYNVFVYITCI